MADDTTRMPCGCVLRYYSGVGWDRTFCDGCKPLHDKAIKEADRA